MANMTNATLWDAVRAAYPHFKSQTSKATSDTFTERGFEKIKNNNYQLLNDFFSLSVRVWLNVVNMSHAKDPLEEQGFGEYFDHPWSEVVQRIAIDSVKPISPAYKGLKDGDSPDPFVVRKPKTSERFFRQNFDYQSLITIPDEFQMKQIFVSEYGMSEFVAGIMESLQNGYTIQKYENKLAALNVALNSTDNPLKDTQKMNIVMSGAYPTEAEAKEIILALNNVVEAMTIGSQSSGFNAQGFASTQDKDRLVMLVRPGFKNALRALTLSGAFHPEYLGIDVDKIITVENFGGLVPKKTAASNAATVYPVYNTLGEVIGYGDTEGATTVTVQLDAVHWQDPNANVYAIIADKGLVFECRQNPYSVEPIRNPRGLYTNMWASSPNNTVAVDPLYNMVAIYKTATANS